MKRTIVLLALAAVYTPTACAQRTPSDPQWLTGIPNGRLACFGTLPNEDGTTGIASMRCPPAPRPRKPHHTLLCGPDNGHDICVPCPMETTVPWPDATVVCSPSKPHRTADRAWQCAAYNHCESRTADLKWWLATAASVGATVADVENTQYALRHGARETNPLQGARPSRARAYAVTMAPTALFTWLSYRWKREDDHDHATLGYTAKVRWYVPQLVNVGWHGVCIGITIGLTGR